MTILVAKTKIGLSNKQEQQVISSLETKFGNKISAITCFLVMYNRPMATQNNVINFSENFPLLSSAPIVESVIDMRIASDVKWDEIALKKDLQNRLKDYPKIEELREFRYHVSAGQGSDQQGKHKAEDLGCVGLKLSSADGFHIVQFNQGAFIFSRLKPYQDWNQFTGEALRLWKVYREIFRPVTVQRLGVRFINRIPVQSDFTDLGDYYNSAPKELAGLNWPQGGFFTHDVFQVPETDYAVNLNKTRVPPNGGDKEHGLVLDIDVYSQNPFTYTDEELKAHLNKMRWVKNKVFFTCITFKLLARFR